MQTPVKVGATALLGDRATIVEESALVHGLETRNGRVTAEVRVTVNLCLNGRRYTGGRVIKIRLE